MAEVTPVSTTTFHNSIGAVTHMTFLDTPYGDWPRIVNVLSDIGIRRVRDGGYDARLQQSSYLNDRTKYAAARGIRFLMGLGGNAPIDTAVAQGRLINAAQNLKGLAFGFEGPNEYDYSGDSNWISNLRHWMQVVYPMVRANPAFNYVPVVGPTIVQPDAVTQLGQVGQWCDIGNIHPYTGASVPTAAHMVSERVKYAPMYGLKQFYASEFGFHNAMNYVGTTNQLPTSEAASAIYILETFLSHFESNVRFSCAFNLIDEYDDAPKTNPEARFGLLRKDFSYKPAATTLRNFIGMLGPDGTPPLTPLDITVDNATIHYLVLRRSDNNYLIPMWREASVWDRNTKLPITVSPLAFNVTIPKATKVTVAYPTRGTSSFVAPFYPTNRVIPAIAGEPIVLNVTTAG